MSQHPTTPCRPFFLQVMFVLLTVCCLWPTFTLAHTSTASRVLNISSGWGGPSNNKCQRHKLCSPPHHPIIHEEEGKEGGENEVLTTAPPSPEPPLFVLHDTSARLSGVEIMVAVFFCLTAWWFLSAIVYSFFILIVLRLQSQGRLNMNDEDFGQVSCCCVKLQLAFLLRSHAIQLDDGGSRRSIRRCLVTRSERRNAMEVLLLQNQNPSNVVLVVDSEQPASSLHAFDDDNNDEDDEETHSIEEPCCSICLEAYGTWITSGAICYASGRST
jgi:hypothetical protein